MNVSISVFSSYSSTYRMDNKNHTGKNNQRHVQSTNSNKSLNEINLQLAHGQKNFINYIADLYSHAIIIRKKLVSISIKISSDLMHAAIFTRIAWYRAA